MTAKKASVLRQGSNLSSLVHTTPPPTTGHRLQKQWYYRYVPGVIIRVRVTLYQRSCTTGGLVHTTSTSLCRLSTSLCRLADASMGVRPPRVEVLILSRIFPVNAESVPNVRTKHFPKSLGTAVPFWERILLEFDWLVPKTGLRF